MLFPTVDVFSYTNTQDNLTTSYLFSKFKLIQLLPDGNQKEAIVEIPPEEIKDTAAIFVDLKGLNIITLVGEKQFKSGNMNWYSYSHRTLLVEKRNIILPLPPGIDKKNQSDWRLAEVTDNGLFFYYVSYKNEEKDADRPILSFHVIKVDNQGKAGKITSVKMDFEDYNVIPAMYKIPTVNNLKIFNPDVLKINFYLDPKYATREKDRGSYWDNSFLGIRVDEKSNRIYTIAALNYDPTVRNENKSKVGFFMEDSKIKTLQINTYDLSGEKIYQSNLHYDAPSLDFSDYSVSYYYSNEIELIPIQNKEGIICKIAQFGHLNLFVLDNKGVTIADSKTKIYPILTLYGNAYLDKFGSDFFSIDDSKNSPYIKKAESAVIKSIESLNKYSIQYISLKNYEVLAYPNSKEKTIKINLYKKN